MQMPEPFESELQKAQTQMLRTVRAAAVGGAFGALLSGDDQGPQAVGAGAAFAVVTQAIASTPAARFAYEKALLEPIRVARRHPREATAVGLASGAALAACVAALNKR